MARRAYVAGIAAEWGRGSRQIESPKFFLSGWLAARESRQALRYSQNFKLEIPRAASLARSSKGPMIHEEARARARMQISAIGK